MTQIKERKLAFYLAGILLVVGAISYAAFPEKAPEEPIRIMFTSVSGNVLFDHQTHGAETGYGLSCVDCHHHPEEEGEEDFRACGDCHQIPQEDASTPEACLDCHDESDVEDTEMIKSADAFHSQCRGCHEDFGAGPGNGPEACSSCHVL
jgi:hypothetical protein